MQNVKKKKRSMPAKLLLVQNWSEMVADLSQSTTVTSFSPLSVMTLHYHILFQISSLEANLGIPTPKLIIINPDLFLQ